MAPHAAPFVGACVLLVEDDASIGAAIRDTLNEHGYTVAWCRDGATAMQQLKSASPHIVLLDAGLPDVDGFTVCRQIRAEGRDVPIVLVTARDSEIDIVVGLDAGANDYVTKPFSMNVLLARVRAHLRGVEIKDLAESIQVGPLRVDPLTFKAFVSDLPVPLRRREFELLLLLCRNADSVVTREQILADVWDLHWGTSTKTVEMHVLALRKRFGDSIDIETVRGIGYRLVTQ